jgi:hypothetical protein
MISRQLQCRRCKRWASAPAFDPGIGHLLALWYGINLSEMPYNERLKIALFLLFLITLPVFLVVLLAAVFIVQLVNGLVYLSFLSRECPACGARKWSWPTTSFD